MSRETGRCVLKLVIAAMITGVGVWVSTHLIVDPQGIVITLCVTGLLAGFVSGDRLSILISPISAWVVSIVEAWVFPNPHTFPVQDLLPWNILYRDLGVWVMIVILIPTGVFAFLGWICRATVAWMRDSNRRPLGTVLEDALRASPVPFALLLDLWGILMVPIMPLVAVPLCILLLIVGLARLIRLPERITRVSGAIMSAGGLVMIPALVIAFHSFYKL